VEALDTVVVGVTRADGATGFGEATLLTGYTDETIATKGSLPKGPRFLQKPFRSVDLLNQVNEVLDLAKASR
ncbi:MAG: hypothetical protein ACLGHL_05015, partial [Actinomycetota bacterium]